MHHLGVSAEPNTENILRFARLEAFWWRRKEKHKKIQVRRDTRKNTKKVEVVEVLPSQGGSGRKSIHAHAQEASSLRRSGTDQVLDKLEDSLVNGISGFNPIDLTFLVVCPIFFAYLGKDVY